MHEISNRFSDLKQDCRGKERYSSAHQNVFSSDRHNFSYPNNDNGIVNQQEKSSLNHHKIQSSIPDLIRNHSKPAPKSSQQWLNIDNKALSAWPAELGDKVASNIVFISASYNNFTDLLNWPNTAQLQLLNLQANRLSSCERLASRWPALRVLVLAENQLGTLSGLEGLAALEVLDVQNNRLNSLVGLSELPKLTVLNAANNQLTSLQGVSALTELHQLSVADNRIGQLEELRPLTQLIQLDVSRNAITHPKQLTAVCSCQKLERLGLSGNPVAKNHSINRLLAKIPVLKFIDGRNVKHGNKSPARKHSVERSRKTKANTSNRSILRRSLSGETEKSIKTLDLSPEDPKINCIKSSSSRCGSNKLIKDINGKFNDSILPIKNELTRKNRTQDEFSTRSSSAMNDTIRPNSRPCTGDVHQNSRKSVSCNGRSRPSTGDISAANGRLGVTIVKGVQSLRDLTSTGAWSAHISQTVQINDVDISQFRTQLQFLPPHVQHLHCIGTNLSRLSQLSWFPATLTALTIDPAHNPLTRSLLWPLYAVFCTSVRTLNGVPVSLVDTRRAQLVFDPLKVLAARAEGRGLKGEALVDTSLTERARRADLLLKSLRKLQSRLRLRAAIRRQIKSLVQEPASEIKCCTLSESIHGDDREAIVESARACLATIRENSAQFVQNKSARPSR